LEEDFQFVGDGAGVAVGEALVAIAALKDEAAPGGGVSKLAAEVVNLPSGDKGRKGGELACNRGKIVRGLIEGLLEGRLGAPGEGRPRGQFFSLAYKN
jgi:hypothetical protein